VSNIDHAGSPKRDTLNMMIDSNLLTNEEFSSLVLVGNNLPAHPPALVPAEHSARLIALGYMSDFAGRLRMTTPGRHRIAAGPIGK
jgi:hypothetical protein